MICNLRNLYLNYLNGNNVDEDYQKDFEYFEKSAEVGYSSGIMMLGYCYEFGIGINIDK